MNPICTICFEYLSKSENVNVTKCGHLFHCSCVTEWFKRNQNCPQCRRRIRGAGKVFLNFSCSETIVENNSFLQNEVKSLQDQLDNQRELSRLDAIRLDYFQKKLLDLEKKNRILKKKNKEIKNETVVKKRKDPENAPIANSSGIRLRSGKIIGVTE